MPREPQHIDHRAPKKTRVRCLGYGGPHSFLTANPESNRICGACRAKQDAMHISPLVHRVALLDGHKAME